MAATAETPSAKPTLHPEFVKNMVRTFDGPLATVRPRDDVPAEGI